MDVRDLQNYNINIGINTDLLSSQTQTKLDDNKKTKTEDKVEAIDKKIANVNNDIEKKYSISSLTYQEMSFQGENLTKDKELLKKIKDNLDELKNGKLNNNEMSNIENQLNVNINKLSPETKKEIDLENIDKNLIDVHNKNQNNFRNVQIYLKSKAQNNLNIDYSKEVIDFDKNQILNLKGSFINAQANTKQDSVVKVLG